MKNIIPILALLLFISCSSSKKLSYEELMEGAPSWVKQSPNTPGYYHGVGMASKGIAAADFREVARQNALAELAAGISVNISSSSILNSYEFDNNYSEYYRDNISLTTQQYLEGYELVDSWESESQFWVYYRLSKSKYKEIKQQRIDKALQTSKSEFQVARNFSADGNASESLRFYIKSLEDIKDFLGENLNTEIDGESEGFSSLLLSEIINHIQSIRILFPVTELEYTRGIGLSKESIVLSVKDENNNPLKGIPVATEFSYAPGHINQNLSDARGEVRLKMNNFDSRKKAEYISAKVNVDKIVKEYTTDPIVRRLLQSIKIPDYVLAIDIISPKFLLSTLSENPGNDANIRSISREFRDLLQRDGFELVKDESFADLILTSKISTTKDAELKGRFSSLLSATITLTKAQGEIVYSKKLSELTGLGDNYESAAEDAYRSLAGKIRINIYPEMYRKAFQSF